MAKKKKTRSKPRTTAKKPKDDAIALLEADHAEARALLTQLEQSTERAVEKRTKLLAKVAPALWIHMRIEEEIFYPAFEAAKRSSDDEVRGIEALAEHGAAKTALTRLEACDPATTEFRAMAKVVFDLIDHHAGEEEDEMFPRARKLLGAEALRAIGQQLRAAKEELKASAGSPKRASRTAPAQGPTSAAAE